MKLVTLGKLVERLRRPPGHLEVVIAELQIEPAMELNGLCYYDQADEARIDELLRRRQAEAILGRPLTPQEQSNHA